MSSYPPNGATKSIIQALSPLFHSSGRNLIRPLETRFSASSFKKAQETYVDETGFPPLMPWQLQTVGPD